MPSIPLTIIDWGSVADWFSGIGSLAAAIVALYVARFSQRIKIHGHCGVRSIVNPNLPSAEVFAIFATNISHRPTVVTHLAFVCGVWRWKRYGIITPYMLDNNGHTIPKPLSDGETGNWFIRPAQPSQWNKNLVDDLEITRFSLTTLRLQIYTSNGGMTALQPEKSFRKTLMALAGLYPSMMEFIDH